MDPFTILDPVTQAEIDEGQHSLDELVSDGDNVVIVAGSSASEEFIKRVDRAVRAGAGLRFRVWAKNPAVLGDNQNLWFGQDTGVAVVLRGNRVIEHLSANASQNSINQAVLEAEQA
jgi:hypothetical protein